MKTFIAALLMACLSSVLNQAYPQSALKLNGKVTDADARPLDGATVYLLRAADSSLVKTALADAMGSFAMLGLKAGEYRLSVSMVGYQSYRSSSFKLESHDLVFPVIILKQAGNELSAVTVSSRKPLIQHQIDRTVVNVDALLSNAGSTAMDVLEKSPGVLVDQNGAISLQGKNSVTIFIDDKPTYLSGSDLENFLKSMPSSTIEQVELMTNPPAKYDAAGNGGIINIRTKRSRVKGFNGSVNLAYVQGVYPKTNNSFNFNYRNNRVNLSGNMGYNYANGYNDLDINRYFGGAVPVNFMQNSYFRRTGQSYSAKLNLDYYASDKTTFGIGVTGLLNPSRDRILNTSSFLNAQNRLDSTIIAHNNERRKFTNGSVNLNYRHQYNKNGRELTADLDYLNYSTDNDQSFLNESFLPNGALKLSDLLTGDLPASIRIYSGKTDYTHPFKDGFKLEGGLKSSYTETDNVADYFYTVKNATRPDYDKTNHFIYKENINAAYINLNKDFKRIFVQAGLRFENTVSNGHQLGNIQKPDSTFKRNYSGLFPTLYFQYKLDSAGSHQISVNYGRRIDRPYYQDLNPFVSPLDKFTYYTGNPFLRPSYTNSVELTHTYKNFTTTFGYNKEKDGVGETIEIVNGIYFSRPGNLGSTVNKSVSVDAAFDFAKWLNFHLFATAINIHTISDFYTGRLDTKGTFFFIKPVFQSKLTKTWSAQLDGMYQSDVTIAQFVAKERYRANAAISKTLSPSTTLKLVVNDIFKSYVNSGIINNLANTHADYRNLSDTRTAVLSLSYRFGKAIADQRKHNASSAESEQNRVKN